MSKQLIQAIYKVLAKARNNVDPKGKTLEQWMKASGYSFLDMRIQWGIENEDIMREHSIDETNEDGDQRDEEEILEEIESSFAEDVRSRFDDWNYKYSKLAFPLTCYRAICVKEVKDIDFKKLGTDWTDNLESATCYQDFRALKGSREFVLKALIKRSDIDWQRSLWNNLNPNFGEVEQEINLEAGKRIKVTEVLYADTWSPLDKTGVV